MSGVNNDWMSSFMRAGASPIYAVEDSEPSVVQRIFCYAVPGAVFGAALSIATFSAGALVLTFASVGGLPQKVRSVALGELSLQNEWQKLCLFEKIAVVAAGVLVVGFLLLGSSAYLSLQPLNLGGLLTLGIILAIPGILSGVLFGSNLCDPPLIDLSDYEIKQY